MHNFLPVIISFYTLDTPYQQEVLHLIESCKKFELTAHIEGIPSLGSWQRNCAYKPQFILEKLKKIKKPLLWVDADAVFYQKPDWQIFRDCDFSVRINPNFSNSHSSRVLSGTVFVNDTIAAASLLKKWSLECHKQLAIIERITELFNNKSPFWDQMSLNTILLKNKKAKIHNLPPSYCKIFDLDEGTDAVIEHRQASRRFKDLIY